MTSKSGDPYGIEAAKRALRLHKMPSTSTVDAFARALEVDQFLGARLEAQADALRRAVAPLEALRHLTVWYLRDGRPTFVYNYLSLERPTFVGKDPLPKGKSQVAVKFDYDGGGAGKGATVTLLVNGTKVAGGRVAKTVPVQFSLGEGFDVGMDIGSAVDFTYQLPFKFTGKIEEVRVELE